MSEWSGGWVGRWVVGWVGGSDNYSIIYGNHAP